MFSEKCDLQGVPKKSGENHNFSNFAYRIFASKPNDIKFSLNESSFDRLSCETKIGVGSLWDVWQTIPPNQSIFPKKHSLKS